MAGSIIAACAHEWRSSSTTPLACAKCGAPHGPIYLPRKPRREGPPLEGTVVRAIREAFAALPYVTCWRNNTGGWKDASGHFTSYGLCEGSSDLVGIVECEIGGRIVGRWWACEVKQPGKRPTEAQFAFLDVVRARGGAAAWVDSVEAAVAFINRARDPETNA